MTGVDTGFFLALCQPRDALHDRAHVWARAVSGPLLVTEHVLWETLNALSQPVDRPKGHALLVFIRTTNAYEVVPATSELFDKGVHLHEQRPDKEWSLTDCITFVVLSERGVRRALAYDHHFEQAGLEALLRRDPP